MSTVIMTTSGMRAEVGQTLDPCIAVKMGMAMGTLLGSGPMVVGGDTRTSTDMVKHGVLSGLMAVGCDVIDIGKVPTPTVQQMIRHTGAKGGMVVTASHNPIQWNGIKLMNASGAFLANEQYQRFLDLYHNDQRQLRPWDSLGSVRYERNAINIHVKKIQAQLSFDALASSGLRVLIDANHGAGSLAVPTLFEALGVPYDMIGEKPDGRFHRNPEPTQDHLTALMQKMSTGKYDIGFAQDADADRLVIVDETGRFIGEDVSLAFCMDPVLAANSQKEPVVVVNQSTSKIVGWLAKKYGATLIDTKVGEAHVTEGIKTHGALVGGEGNGGVIYPAIGWGRDSLVGIVLALQHLVNKQQTVSQILREYPQYVMLREKKKIKSKEKIGEILETVVQRFPEADLDRRDGVKLTFPDAWIHVRASNTEPIIRIFVEADTDARAQALMRQVIDMI